MTQDTPDMVLGVLAGVNEGDGDRYSGGKDTPIIGRL